MSDDPLAGYGLRAVQLADRDTFRPHFSTLREPLSDYTFAQIYTWRNSLHLVWKILRDHLCVFANGTGDLTLLMPPIAGGSGAGDTACGADAALRQAFELMDDYNAARGVADRSRVEYASQELLGRFDCARFNVVPMGADYVYDTARMIDLAGGDLASKRQAKNRFLRLYEHRVERYDPAKHLDDCIALLQGWRTHQDAQHLEETNANSIKRQKETIATELALRAAADLELSGMVVYVKDAPASPRTQLSGSEAGSSIETTNFSLKGFTFGEPLGHDQSSIVIEKTDLAIKGLAQFIFSEFCSRQWADRPLCNVGDDWGLQSLAWTKMSYRPVKMLQKFVLKKAAVSTAGVLPLPGSDALTIRPATKSDLPVTLELERACFSSDLSLKKRQLEYLQQRESAVFLVAERSGNVIGESIALLRQHRRGLSGRIYSLAVDQRHRGRQVGNRLLQSLLSELTARGVCKIYLEVEQTNEAAISLYLRHGFRVIGALPDYYGPGGDAVHMLCDLASPLLPLPTPHRHPSTPPAFAPLS